MNKIRNIIDSNVDNDPNEKTRQLAWTWSDFQKSSFYSTHYAEKHADAKIAKNDDFTQNAYHCVVFEGTVQQKIVPG